MEKLPLAYDETNRKRWYDDAIVYTIAERENLKGYLPWHDERTDGSFGIVVCPGSCVLVNKQVYDSIPHPYRPPIEPATVQTITFAKGDTQRSVGSTIVPIIMTDRTTSRKFLVKLYALVVEQLRTGMIIGQSGAEYFRGSKAGADGSFVWEFDFESGGVLVGNVRSAR
ncbi:hypothetical protein TREMEDRAFT_29749 [Tremella mesenterica DSM 1558]|uniref:uncharacterized protein n=1 Tax=Tremella mesenterica (strain ATCC 24925 / CBS 8224 / DSM 1558 / NBRC 9311 / NRRL Y-6157 / RJB 2259-6 / UBC 559-6) TaxID=578456 RepID=UPI0003F4A1AD|nr:uncharacterized protein TREMEDRAFT_29749 [Tremella mesenterica DSM 1558]EIW69816.1 hypothetical protein TREMEDRAFT_29749 [Tremella mesenterica DSM 1558]